MYTIVLDIQENNNHFIILLLYTHKTYPKNEQTLTQSNGENLQNMILTIAQYQTCVLD